MTLTLPTEQEAEAIGSGDKELKDRYYLANRENIERLAKAYCRKVLNFKDWEDLAHEVYLCFDRLDFRSPANFTRSLYDCFWRYRLGGLHKFYQLYDRNVKAPVDSPELTILDSPVQGLEDRNVIDLIPSDFDVYEELEPRSDITDDLYSFLCSYLAREQTKVFTYLYYTGMTHKEIGKVTGKTETTVTRTKTVCFNKFRKHADELRSWLTYTGYYPAA